MTTARWQALTIAVTSAPLAALLVRFALEGPGPDPVDDLTHVTGEWALRWLLLCLAVTPARKAFGWSWAAPLRRTLGLAAFAYATVHLTTWAVLDLGLEPAAVFEDLTERPYVMVGMAAFVILAALAATSTRRSIRRLGRRWQLLHRAVYAAGIFAVLHHFWLIKADYRPAIVHGALLAALLAVRLVRRPGHRATPHRAGLAGRASPGET